MSEAIENALKSYDLNESRIAEIEKECLDIKVKDASDAVNYELAKKKLSSVVSLRTGIEKKRVALNADALAYSKAVNGEAKRLTALISPIEEHLRAQREVVEAEQRRIKEEKENKVKEEIAQRKREEEAKLEEQRLENERKAKELADAQAKIEADRLAFEKEKQDLADAKAEQERKELAAAEAEKQAKIDAENAKIKAEQDEAARIEQEKKHAEEVKAAKLKAVEDEKERVAKEEADRIEAEAAKKAEAERRAALAPDIDKMHALGSALLEIEYPLVGNRNAHMIVEETKAKIEKIANDLLAIKK